jgi:hypothetical protein
MRLLLVDGTNAAMRYAFALLRDRQVSPTVEDVARVLQAVETGLRDLASQANANADGAVIALELREMAR